MAGPKISKTVASTQSPAGTPGLLLPNIAVTISAVRPAVLNVYLALVLAACTSAPPTQPPTLRPPVVHVQVNATSTPAPTPTLIRPTATATATAVPVDPCALYDPTNPLLISVDRENALPRDFEPTDLITLTLPAHNEGATPLRARRAIEEPLVAMLDATNQVGLTLKPISAYRSYTEQALAHQKWVELYPDRAGTLSAVPGHSEHQLGTAVDFTTPEVQARMPNGFHIRFAQTPEGLWLADHAADYGFTLSYPEWATAETGYEWEPWHYRYVGVDLAQHLARHDPPMTVSGYIRQCAATP